jgi:hypothetical protein
VNTTCCCQGDAPVNGKSASPPGRASRLVGLAEWLIPSAILALMPKCPACVAAYVALATGIGISMPTATYIRITLGVLCVAGLMYLVARSTRRAFLRMTTPLRA